MADSRWAIGVNHSASRKREGDMAEEDILDEKMTILTAREAAEYLRVSLYTLRKMESEGSLTPFRTPGGHRRYSLRMLDEYLEKSRQPPRCRESESEPEVQ
jgi:excisionase family DNA binding protein